MSAARLGPTAAPVCTKPTPRPRYLSRMTSPISIAPVAHSPPKARPCKPRRMNSCSKFCAKLHRKVKTGRTVMVTNKRVRCALTGENPGARLPVSGRFADADVAHFGNIRGTNEFEDHDVVIILGRDQPSPRDAERRAMAIWYDTKRPIRRIEAGKKGQVQ